MANFGTNELKVHTTTPNFRIVFYNVLDNFSQTNENSLKFDEGSSFQTMGQLGINSYFAFSPQNPNKYFSGANIQSYTFSNGIDDIDGSFSLTIKEDTRELQDGEQYFMDQVQKLDVVEIIENGSVEFYGVVRTISIGATAGVLNKVVTVSGISAAGLLNMFNIATDAASMNFLNGDATNKNIADRVSKLFIADSKKDKKGVEVAEVFRIIYLAMYYVANGWVYNAKIKQWQKSANDSPFASSKIQRIFRFVFGVAHDDVGTTETYDTKIYSKPVEFLDCDLRFKYQLVSNLFNQTEINIVSYFKGMLPSTVYEFFHKLDDNNKPKIVIREVPFSPSAWKSLKKYSIDPSLITDYTLTQTDTNIFTAFYAFPAGAPGSAETYRKANSTDPKGNKIQKVDGRLVQTYGYIPLDVNFVGYKTKDSKADDIFAVSAELSERLAGYFKNLKDFWNGDVTFVNMMETGAIDVVQNGLDKNHNVISKTVKVGTSKSPRVGEKVTLCGLEFYVTNATHTWRYGEPCKINLHIERGGKYDKKGNYIEPVEYNGDIVTKKNPSSLSRTWAELLTKE